MDFQRSLRITPIRLRSIFCTTISDGFIKRLESRQRWQRESLTTLGTLRKSLDWQTEGTQMERKRARAIVIVVLFGISTLYDFYRGHSHGESIVECSLFVLFGFFLLACIWWAFSRKNSN